MAVYMGKDGGIIPEAGGSIGMKGDALFVDLGSGRNLIVALSHGANAADFDGMSRLAMNAFAAAGQKVQFKDMNRLEGKVEVHGDLIPTLVTSTDLVDPKAAQVIDPSKIEATFGDGFHLSRVIIEMVPVRLWPLDFGGPLGEPVTRGIETKLPWVTSVKGYLSGRFACNPSLEACLEAGHFRRK
jgi:regulator of RNase E activity RraB